MYHGTQYIIFKLDDLRYLMNMLHLVQVRQSRYIIARDDVRAYSIAALGASEFIEPNLPIAGLIQYDQFF
jgi:hypothetical protein